MQNPVSSDTIKPNDTTTSPDTVVTPNDTLTPSDTIVQNDTLSTVDSAGAIIKRVLFYPGDGNMVSEVRMIVPVNSIMITPGRDSLALTGKTPYIVDMQGDVPPAEMKQITCFYGSNVTLC